MHTSNAWLSSLENQVMLEKCCVKSWLTLFSQEHCLARSENCVSKKTSILIQKMQPIRNLQCYATERCRSADRCRASFETQMKPVQVQNEINEHFMTSMLIGISTRDRKRRQTGKEA